MVELRFLVFRLYLVCSWGKALHKFAFMSTSVCEDLSKESLFSLLSALSGSFVSSTPGFSSSGSSFCFSVSFMVFPK